MVYEIVFAYNVDMFAMLVINNIYTSVTIILLLYRYEIFMLHIENIYNLYQTRNISNIKKYGFCKYKLPETFILFRWSGQCAFIISYYNLLIFNTNYKKIRLLLWDNIVWLYACNNFAATSREGTRNTLINIACFYSVINDN